MPARVRGVWADTLPAGATAEAGAVRSYGIELDPQRRELTSDQGRCTLRLGMEVRADVVTRRTTVLAFLLNKLRISD